MASEPNSSSLPGDSPRCGTCRFWESDLEKQYFPSAIYKSCQAIPHDDASNYDPDMDLYLDATPDPEDVTRNVQRRAFREQHPAVTTDYSSYAGALRTRAEFGCVLYHFKET